MIESPTEINAANPPTLSHVIGQREAIERLRVSIDAAFADAKPLEHFLFAGPGGTGKTLIASKIIPAEMGVRCREVLAQTLNADGSLPALLLECDDGDILFIDEAHELSTENQTLLYRAMTDRRLFIQRTNSKSTTRSLPLAAFCLIAATTDSHELLPPFLDRFVTLSFDYYSEAELVALMKQRAKALKWDVENVVFAAISKLGRGTPRIGLKILNSCHQVCRSEGQTEITLAHFRRACDLDGLDVTFGLTKPERRLLNILHGANGAVRLNVIASRLGLPVQSVAQVVEGYLIRSGWLDKVPEGRVLTPDGMNRLRANGSLCVGV
jgi:Holliday junction DNA helicase RuvB